MLTKCMKRDISRRFDPIIRYLAISGYYWDKREKKFVLTSGYFYFMWHSTYYLGQTIQFCFGAFLLFQNYLPIEILEEDLIVTTNPLLMLTSGVEWLLISGVLAIGSLIVEFVKEFAETMNQIYALDSKLQACYNNYTLFGAKQDARHKEVLIKAICYLPFTFPIIFAMAIFNPADPIHAIIETVFEIEISVNSYQTWLIIGIESILVLNAIQVCICMIMVVFLAVFTCQHWFEASMPTRHSGSSCTYLNGIRYVETEQIGKISENTPIWIYRSFQILTGIMNSAISNNRMAYHCAMFMMVAVLSCFALIRHWALIIGDGSPMTYSLAAILLIALVFPSVIFYLECYFLDGLQVHWKSYTKRCISATPRASVLHKAAKSFRPVNILTTYPFCNVNRSTFLEWCNIAINNLVSLLVTVEN